MPPAPRMHMRGAKPRPNSCMQDWSCWPPTTPTLVLWRSKTPQPGNRGAAAGAIHSAPATLALFAAAEDTPHSHGCPGSPRLSRKHTTVSAGPAQHRHQHLARRGSASAAGHSQAAPRSRALCMVARIPAHGEPLLAYARRELCSNGVGAWWRAALLTAAESHLSQSGRPFDAQHYLAQQNCHCSEHYGDHSFRKARGER